MGRGRHGMSGPGLTSHCPDCASPSPLTPRSMHDTCPCGQAFKHMDRHREADRGVNTRVAPTHRETQVLSHRRPSCHPNTVAEAQGTQTHNRHTPDGTHIHICTHHTHCPDTRKLRAHAHNHAQTFQDKHRLTHSSLTEHTHARSNIPRYTQSTQKTPTLKHTYMWTQ